MGLYGSVWAHIKTGRSPMAQDHVQTPPEPQKGYKNPNMTQTNLKTGWGRAGIISDPTKTRHDTEFKNSDLDLRIRPAPAASGNPSGWAQAGPKWVGPLGIDFEKQGFRTAWLITGRKFPWKNLKSGSSLLTFRDLCSHICQIFLRMARWGDLHFWKSLDFSGSEIFWPENMKFGLKWVHMAR